MKKQWLIVIMSCLLSFGFTSCTSNDQDTEWRDENLAFLDKVSSQDGIKYINDSINGNPGIFYKVLKEGTGKTPIYGNIVEVSYAGWIYNDTIPMDHYMSGVLDEDEAFDSSNSYEFSFGGAVIDGWTLAIQYMPVGSKWRVFIPYNLGYGSSETTSIPAYSTLIFDIDFKKIVSDN